MIFQSFQKNTYDDSSRYIFKYVFEIYQMFNQILTT
jgi:hypothetical protein